MNVKLQQAIGAARAGESQKAQVLLAQILKEDTQNVHAWFLLSHLVESKEKKVAFLQKVLDLDPNHQKARERLTELVPPETDPIVEGVASVVENVPAVVEEKTAVVALAEPEEQPTPVTFTKSAEDELFATDDDDELFEDDGDELPAWLSADDEDVLTPEALAAEALPDFSDSVDPDDLPDWLTNTNIDDWTATKPWEQIEDQFEDLDTFEEDDDELELMKDPLPVKSVIDVARELQESDPPPLVPDKLPAAKSDSWLNRVLIFLIVIAAVVLILLLYIVITSFG
ncbi:MAG: hypothetical protein R3C62_05300 [Chloroflexota bacterium]